MALFQIMKASSDGQMYTYGKINKSLSRLKKRIKQVGKGWIVDLSTNKIVAVRGFSKDYMQAVKACGMGVV